MINAGFILKCRLDKHKKSHLKSKKSKGMNKKKLECDECGKQFSKEKNLTGIKSQFELSDVKF